MNYIKIYNSIIDRAKNRTIDGYVERHHIVPRFIKKTNETVNLTAREHYICHWLLARHHNTPKAWYAFNCMHRVSKGQKRYLTARGYQEAREEVSNERRKNLTLPSQKGKRVMYNPYTEVSVFILPDQIQDYIAKGFVEGRKPHSKKTKDKISNTKKGIVASEDTKSKMSNAHTGKTLSEITKQKLREFALDCGRRPPSRKNIKLSDEIKAKMSQSHKNRKKIKK